MMGHSHYRKQEEKSDKEPPAGELVQFFDSKDPKQQTATTLHTYLNEYDDPNGSQHMGRTLEASVKNLHFNYTLKPEELDRRSDARNTNRRKHAGRIV
jgi:hypothetical protein